MPETITENEISTPTIDENEAPEPKVTQVGDDKEKKSPIEKFKNKLNENKKKKLEKKKEEKIDKNKMSIKSRAKFTLVIAALVFLFSIVIKAGSLYIFESQNILTAIDILGSLAESISGIILGLSLGNMYLDFFSYADYMKERIEEVIIEKEFLETLNDTEKEKMIAELESSLYFEGREIQSDSLYHNIKNKIVPLKEYYEKSFTHIDCEVKNGKIYKTFYTTLVINLKEDVTRYKLPFSVCFNKKDITKKKKAYNIKDVQVNGESIEILDNYLVCDDSEELKGQAIYSFVYPFTLKKGNNTIYYESHSVVDISDNTYARSIAVPCKNCVIEMYLQNDDYKLLGQGFAIDKEKILDIQYFNNACRIEFKDWIIPGDGCIFVINPQNWLANFVHIFFKKLAILRKLWYIILQTEVIIMIKFIEEEIIGYLEEERIG